MKKTLLKGLTVVTLLICLITALVGCSKDNGSGSTPTVPQVKDLTHPFLVDDTNQKNAETFFNTLKDSFLKPYENKTGDLLLNNSSTVIVKNPNADSLNPTFDYDENKSVYVDLNTQAIVNVDAVEKNIKLIEVYTYFNARGKKDSSQATKSVIGNIYFKNTNSSSDSLLVSIKMPDAKDDFNKKFLIGNINNYMEASKSLGTMDFNQLIPDLDNFLGNFLAKVGFNLDEMIGTDLQSLLDQQVKQVLTRMLFKFKDSTSKELVPLFNVVNNKYSLDVNSTNINESLNHFFSRADSVIKDTEYDPLLDYTDDNATDVLNNNSDQFYKQVIGNMLPDLLKKSKLSLDMGRWAKDFAIKNDTIDTPVKLNITFDKTDKGLENGLIDFSAAKDTYITLPLSTAGIKQTNKLAYDIDFKIQNINMTAIDLGNNTIDTSNFEKKNEVELMNAENILNFTASGTLTGKEGSTIKQNLTYDFSIDANPLILSLIEGKNDAPKIKDAINSFNLVIKNQDKEVYKVEYNKEKDATDPNNIIQAGFNITYLNNGNYVTKNFSFSQTANLILQFRKVITFKGNETIITKLNTDLIGNIIKNLFQKKGVNIPTFEKDVNGNIIALNIKKDFDKEFLEMFNLTFDSVFGNNNNPQFINRIFGMNSHVDNVSITMETPVFFPKN